MLIDSHAHLDMAQFDRDREEVIDRARLGGVTHIVTIGIDLSSSLKALELANRHEFIFSTVGYHPHRARDMDPPGLQELAVLAGEPKIVAWGEIGLDFFRNRSPREKQIEAFETQIDMAMDLGLPLIIHDRQAHREVYEILQRKGNGKHKGVIHCFSGDLDLAVAFIGMGFHISVPGTVTYKNAYQVRDVASRIPLESMLVETDAPFLTPVPERGKRNEPLFVTFTAQRIARLRNMDFQEVARQTGENAKRLFKLPDRP
jgi:TatD DNase family protein